MVSIGKRVTEICQTAIRRVTARRISHRNVKVFRSLSPGDVAIDCGANVGEVTARMAARGAEVFAFEPNPIAYETLCDRFEATKNVHCINKAVLDKNDTMRLFLHQRAEEDPLKWSTGSSLLECKKNVDGQNWVDVEVINIAEFINALGRNVRLMKLDVEGMEWKIINSLIDSGAINRIEKLLVEDHDEKIPELRDQGAAVRNRISELQLRQIDLRWI